MLTCTFDNAEDAAQAVVEISRERNEDFLHPVPFNRFAPSDSVWWLVPERKGPYFRYGKIEIAGETFPAPLFVGLCVEKGLGPGAAPALAHAARTRLVMNDDWLWHSFIKKLKTGAFRADVDRVRSAAESEIFVRIGAHVVAPDGSAQESDACVMRVTREVQVEPGEGSLLKIQPGDTLRHAGEKICAIENPDWTWITFHARLLFDVAPRRTPGAYDEEMLWDNAIKPWSAWLR